MYDKKIEITVPVLNEQDTLIVQVEKIINFLTTELNEFSDIKIIIADNGSTDQTQKLAELLEAKYNQVNYLRLNERGVGRALKASWSVSTADIIGYMDLDLATDLKYLRPAFDALVLANYDIVTGSRLAKGAKVYGRTMIRNITSRCFNLLVKNIFHTKFSDGMCGFKFLKRDKLSQVLSTGMRNDGWFFATELLIVGEFLNFRIKDLPVTWTDDPSSKVKIGKLSREYIEQMILLKKHLKEHSQ
ncbi:glycosyltransferase [Atlantibacter subterraneus]|uniref:glycosyltransferase n=1 Tax=Atlantibacter subterraneus TaxID=255519 RepID=UPI0028A9F22A|nr:glycosyltransferase [Atlantibacter subterranea]